MEAVKNASSLLHFSGHSELETGLLWNHHMLDRKPISSPPPLIFSLLAMRDLYEQIYRHVHVKLSVVTSDAETQLVLSEGNNFHICKPD